MFIGLSGASEAHTEALDFQPKQLPVSLLLSPRSVIYIPASTMMQRLCKKMRPLALIVYSCIPLTVAHMTMGTPLAFFPDHDNAKTPLGNAGGYVNGDLSVL